MQKKFKHDIVKKVKEEVLQEKRQEALKEKYEIADDVVVVEKSNMIKWTIRTMVAFIRCICAILIFLLSLTGGCALLYPITRHILVMQGWHILQDVVSMMT